jgi:hypothetical protein
VAALSDRPLSRSTSTCNRVAPHAASVEPVVTGTGRPEWLAEARDRGSDSSISPATPDRCWKAIGVIIRAWVQGLLR